MVVVPEGTFWMGCRPDLHSGCGVESQPYHEVHVPWFAIDRTEVTVGRFRSCVEAGECSLSSRPGTPEFCNYDVPGRDEHPMNCVDYRGAAVFCEWVGKRLCTSAEWEKAAKGTDDRKHPWGNEEHTCDRAVYDSGTESPQFGCGRNSTWDVGMKPAGASPYGVLDMGGNVMEWVKDRGHHGYSGAPTDGSAWMTPEAEPYNLDYGLRDCSFLDPPENCTTWAQGGGSLASAHFGFRCCRSL